jgi:DNA-directed RNA polymerase specialized sigma24 family protein
MVSAIRGAYSRAKRERRLVQWPDEYQPASPAVLDYDALDLHLAIKELPRAQKRLMEMFIEGLRGDEIANELNTTLDGVYTRASRARDALREVLGRGDRKTHGEQRRAGLS